MENKLNRYLSKNIKEKLKLLPINPGVYFMRGKEGKIIYIGKAKNLKKRVITYFNNSAKDNKTSAMVSHISDFEYIITENETEALILEAGLITKYKPHYNTLLKDQKSFPFIAITNEPFPRIVKARNVVKSRTEKISKYKKYYGPYVDGEKASLIIKFIEDTFLLRRCKLELPLRKKIRPCLYYHIGKCSAPCAGFIEESDYSNIIESIIMLFDGNIDKLKETLTERMKDYAKKTEFEEAKRIREQISLISSITVLQSVYVPESEDKDIIGIYGESGSYAVVVLYVRSGKLIDKKSFSMQGEAIEAEVLRAFFLQYYSIGDIVPPNIITAITPNESEHLTKWLTKISEHSVLIKTEEESGLLNIASENAKHIFKETHLMKEIPQSLTRLKEVFRLKNIPSIIESFDIAHIQGTFTMAGMVRFVNGVADNKNYRLFDINTVRGVDDFASIKEAVYRRYKRLKNEKSSFPDLILIDGGRGQLNSAIEALKELNIKGQPIMALAKRFEEIYLPNRDEPVRLPDNDAGKLLLQKIRDETHRFINTSHGNKRSREMLRSELEDIKGVGVKTIERLYSVFDGIDAIKKATVEDLKNVTGVSSKVANSIYGYFNKS